MADSTHPATPPAPRMSAQRIHTEPSLHGWMETRIDTLGYADKVDSETTIRWRHGWKFLDISLTEYTGLSRRAKVTGVRLGEPAARVIFEALRAVLGEERDRA